MDNTPTTETSRSLLAKIFVSPDERRLRAGWRLLVHLFILWVLTLTLIAGLGFFVAAGGTTFSLELSTFLGQLGSALAITLSVYIARGYLDQRSFTSLGIQWDRQALRDLVIGAVIGLAMITVVFLILLLAGWIQISGFGWLNQELSAWFNSFLTIIFIFILGAWLEELLFRGYWLQNLADGLNLFWGVLLSSLAFAALHLSNPGATLASFIGIFLAGLFFSYCYVATGRLWLPIGLHFGWNFFLGPVFGMAVSGIEAPAILVANLTGPELITGGNFGPEAGLVLLPGLILGVLLVYAYSRWQRSEARSTSENLPAENQS